MANERNKILPYALSAIEGVNIQSQEDYSASSETTDGVSTGLANGNNFNKLAKQVSIMSSSLAEFIVNTLAEQTISDTNSIEEISSSLNSAILKLIKDNEPVIPDQSGITVIDSNNADITSFNQITKNGIYYIYKQLSDGPSQNGEAIKYNFIYLIVINVSVAAQNIDACMQMTSFGPYPSYLIPGNIGSSPMVRAYDKTSKQWNDWVHTFGISFINNNIVISEITIDKLPAKFPIIGRDTTFSDDFNTFMYSATKEQMRSLLGIADSPDLTDYFNKTTDKINLASQVTGQLKNANIADNAITTSKIASLAITADKLASSSVTNDKIANGAVTDAKFSGTLSIAKGGTNTEDGYLFANVMTFSELRKRFTTLGSSAVTTEQFVNAIDDSRKTAFKVDMVSANTHISDFPLSNAILEVVRLTDNTVILTAKDLFVLTTYEFRKSPEGQFSGWIKTRNQDGTLPVSIGGTGTTDGFGWKNVYSDAEFNAKVGLSYPFTTQQLANAIFKLNQPLFCMVYSWQNGQSFITDFPGSGASHRTIINYRDMNQFYLETIDPYDLTTYICNVSKGVAGKWIKTRNDDGSIPESLIPATQKVTVADGVTWIETPLSNGKSMLYGIAQKTPTGDGMSTTFWKMIPPKSIDVSTIQLTANYLATISSLPLFAWSVGNIIGGGYKNITVSEEFMYSAAPKHNFLLTMQAITA